MALSICPGPRPVTMNIWELLKLMILDLSKNIITLTLRIGPHYKLTAIHPRAGQHEGILISNLDQGPKYYFKVRAIDTQGNFSEWSNLVSDFAVNDFIINVPDTGFESTVRLNTHKSEGDLFYKDMLNVEALSKGPFVVTNISGMEYMKNLNRIYFLHTGISDLTPLSDLEVLNSIIIVHAQINDLNPIGKLTNMAELNLAENQITDISPIRNFTNLLILNLSENQLSDISILSDFKKLSRLQLDSNNIVDFSPISELTDLSQLDLQNNEIDDISFIEDLSSLRRLYLGSNNIKDISVLSKLNGIRYLYLKNNNITDILPLVHNENFGEGDEIDLSNNPLSEQSINEYIPALEARGVTVVY